MKLYLDIKNRRFVKSAASNVALTTLVLKRRDQVPVEIVFVENGAAVTPPTGTTASIGLKAKFSDSNFLAFAAPGTSTLDLYTEPVEAAFLSNPASLPALLEVKWGAASTALRTATLQAEVQNSVILGTEGTPQAMPDGRASQQEAEAGTDNAKWMTPLRTAQAIAVLAPPPPPLSFQTTRHTGNGTTTAFQPPGVLTNADSPSAISVSINGVLQEPNLDYTLDIASNRVVLDAPLPSGDKIVLTRPILLPSNTTLTAEQIGAIPASALAAETQSRTQADRRLLGLTLALS